MTTITIDMLRGADATELREALFLGCDFDLRGCENEHMELEDDIIVEGVEGYELLAAEGAGGRYVVLAPSGHLLYISSEAEAGVIAASLTEGLEILAAIPHWQDLLRRSNGGDLSAMRMAHPALQEAHEGDDPEADEARAFVRSALALKGLEDPLGALQRAVTEFSGGVSVRNREGEPYDFLFGY